MAWTEDDLKAVQDAITRLVKGEDVATATLNGQPVSYNKARLPELKALRAEMLLELSDNAADGSRVHLTKDGGKGL